MNSNDLKGQVERATARNFIDWYNKENSRKLVLSKKQEAPDFVYVDEIGEIGIEITTCFYNQYHAALVSKWARGYAVRENRSKLMREPEKELVASINERLREKAQKRYGENCFLVIRVPSSPLTTNAEFERDVVPAISVPMNHPFRKIFVTVDQQHFFTLQIAKPSAD